MAGEKAKLVHLGSVTFRSISRTKYGGTLRESFGVVIPKDAVVKLGWKPGERVELWMDEARGYLIIQRVELRMPEVGR